MTRRDEILEMLELAKEPSIVGGLYPSFTHKQATVIATAIDRYLPEGEGEDDRVRCCGNSEPLDPRDATFPVPKDGENLCRIEPQDTKPTPKPWPPTEGEEFEAYRERMVAPMWGDLSAEERTRMTGPQGSHRPPRTLEDLRETPWPGDECDGTGDIPARFIMETSLKWWAGILDQAAWIKPWGQDREEIDPADNECPDTPIEIEPWDWAQLESKGWEDITPMREYPSRGIIVHGMRFHTKDGSVILSVQNESMREVQRQATAISIVLGLGRQNNAS